MTGEEQLVIIDWYDSHSNRGWHTLDEIREECVPLLCRSVGWLIHENKEHIVIVPHLAGMDDEACTTSGSGQKTIPVVAVQKCKVLR